VAKSSIPKTVKVGPHYYSVVRSAPGIPANLSGECSFDKLRIFVRERLRRSKVQEILLHEILHACTYPNLNSEEKMTDEAFVNGVSPLLLQVLRENPHLVKFLTE
jgi:hypothetical protein